MEKLFEKLNLPYEKLYKFSLIHFLALGGVIVVIVAALYFFLLHETLVEEIDKQEIRKEEASKKLETYRATITQEPVVRDLLATVIGKLSERKTQMPSDTELPRLLNRVADFGKILDVNIISFQLNPATRKDFYKVIPLSISFHADYSNTAGFFDALQNLLQLVKINSLSMRLRPIAMLGTDEEGERALIPTLRLQTSINVTTYAYID